MVLPQEEVRALRLDLRVCYYLRAWSPAEAPKSIYEWAETLGWEVFHTDEAPSEESQRLAAEKAVFEAMRMYFLTLEVLAER